MRVVILAIITRLAHYLLSAIIVYFIYGYIQRQALYVCVPVQVLEPGLFVLVLQRQSCKSCSVAVHAGSQAQLQNRRIASSFP